MEMVMTNGFAELSVNEMEIIDGGIAWDHVGEYIAGSGGAAVGSAVAASVGTRVGGSVGWLAGPGGAVAGAIVGGAIGVAIYTWFD